VPAWKPGVVREFSYIVVGGGTAGCVVAARLSQDPSVRVLLEAGGAERTEAMRVPNAWPGNLGSAADWADVTTSQAGAGAVAYPRGQCWQGQSRAATPPGGRYRWCRPRGRSRWPPGRGLAGPAQVTGRAGVRRLRG